VSESSRTVDELKVKIQRSANILTTWFKASGLVVNETKTEFCVFHKTKKIRCQIEIGETAIQSKNEIKALGVTLDLNLTWESHINQTTKNCQKVNSGFRILKKYFNKDELLSLATSMFFSKLYYASELWLWPNISSKLLKTLTSTSSKVLKTITGIKCNHEDGISFYELHKQTNRATPLMMSHYNQATALHRIMHNQTPDVIYVDLATHHIESRRHYKPIFIKNNKTKSGENIFRNRIRKTCNEMPTDITYLSYDQLKMTAKRTFLKFD